MRKSSSSRFFFCFQDGPPECKECQKAPKFICPWCDGDGVNLCECVSCGKSYVYDEKQCEFRGSKQVQGCVCGDPRFFRSVVPLKCSSCHQWCYLEPGSSCLLCDRTYTRVADHAGHFEDKHPVAAALEKEEQLEKMKKTGARLKNDRNEVDRLKRSLVFTSASATRLVKNSLDGVQKNLRSVSKYVDKAVADNKHDTEKLEMRMANRPLKWQNKFLRTVPESRGLVPNPVCISCPYVGRGEYVAHLQSEQHVVQAYPLLVAEQLLQSLGRFAQAIIDIILEYSVDAPYSEFRVTPTAGPPFKITLDELLPFLHQRSTKKKRKPFQADQEGARKYRKVSWHYVGAKPMKAKPWCKKTYGKKWCNAFLNGGICHCGPDASVAPKFNNVYGVPIHSLTRDSPARFAGTKVYSCLPVLSTFLSAPTQMV